MVLISPVGHLCRFLLSQFPWPDVSFVPLGVLLRQLSPVWQFKDACIEFSEAYSNCEDVDASGTTGIS